MVPYQLLASFITNNEGFATSYQKCFVFQHFSNQPCKLLIMRYATKRAPGTILRSAKERDRTRAPQNEALLIGTYLVVHLSKL